MVNSLGISLPVIFGITIIGVLIAPYWNRVVNKWQGRNSPEAILAKIAAGKAKAIDQPRYLAVFRELEVYHRAEEYLIAARIEAITNGDMDAARRLDEFTNQMRRTEDQPAQETPEPPPSASPQDEGPAASSNLPSNTVTQWERQLVIAAEPLQPPRRHGPLPQSLSSIGLSETTEIVSDSGTELASLGSESIATLNTLSTTEKSPLRDQSTFSHTSNDILRSEQQGNAASSASRNQLNSSFSATSRFNRRNNSATSAPAKWSDISRSTSRDDRQEEHPEFGIPRLQSRVSSARRMRNPDHQRIRDSTAAALAAAQPPDIFILPAPIDEDYVDDDGNRSSKSREAS